MLIWLADFLKEYFQSLHGLNIIQYVTFRSILAALTALLSTLCFGPFVIRWLKQAQIGQVIRLVGPESHYQKAGTPTMGGGLIVLAVIFSVLLWARLNNRYILMLLGALVLFAGLGGYDDFKKLILKHSRGLPGRTKYLVQSIFAIGFAGLLYYLATNPIETSLLIPYTKSWFIPLGAGVYLFWVYFIIVGSSNAVNLTDGLDGLAIGPVILISGALGIFAYVTGHKVFADYLMLSYLPGVGEIAVFTGAIVGAGLGFLWFNTYPALIFMGDIGSLSLGAVMGLMAVMIRQELVFAIMSGIFVVETLSVIIQVGSYKFRQKRIFKMAPIHHHFELSGWPEPRVVVRFWIITVILVLIGLCSLKIR